MSLDARSGRLLILVKLDFEEAGMESVERKAAAEKEDFLL